MHLEVCVFDDIRVFDSINDAVAWVVKELTSWERSNDRRKFSVHVRKMDNKAPPALSINVGEDIQVNDKLV